MGVWGAEGVTGAFFSATAAFGVGCWACAGAAAGVGVSCFFSCLGSSWAGLEVAAAAIKDLSSSYSIKSAPTSHLSDSATNNFFITPAHSDLISTYLIIFNINYKYIYIDFVSFDFSNNIIDCKSISDLLKLYKL